MGNLNDFFADKKVRFNTLEPFGFVLQKDGYLYSAKIVDGLFRMNVLITLQGQVRVNVCDSKTGEPYILHIVTNSSGSFVAKVRQEYNNILTKIADNCFDVEMFHEKQTQTLINYLKNKYHCELEFLWSKFPNTAVMRHANSKKWFIVFQALMKNKLGFIGTDMLEIINIRLLPTQIINLIDHKVFFPAHHMNKQYWISINLSALTSLDEVYSLVDKSFTLTQTKKDTNSETCKDLFK